MAEMCPHHIDAMINIAVNNLFWQPSRRDEDSRASKIKAIIMYFCCIMEHMVHWSMVETLASLERVFDLAVR